MDIDGTKPRKRRVTICNQKGLHARASAMFVRMAEGFEAELTVSRDGTSVPGTSIVGLLMLGAATGCEIEISAEGPDAHKALDALVDLVERGFDETD